MKDFAEWCLEQNLVTISEDGTVEWKRFEKEPVGGGTLIFYKDGKADKVRDIRHDLSKDYKDYARSFGTVWPFKVLARGKAKPVANVAK